MGHRDTKMIEGYYVHNINGGTIVARAVDAVFKSALEQNQPPPPPNNVSHLVTKVSHQAFLPDMSKYG